MNRGARAAGLAALVGAVAAVHGCIVQQVGVHLDGFGRSEPMPERMKATYVRSMELVEPVVVAKVAPAPRPKRVVAAAPPDPVVPVVPAASEPEPVAEPASAPAEVASSEPVVVPAEAAASAPSFEWPVATRVSFNLTGYYRGEVHGSAQVEWLREDERYQVHLDVYVGLKVAPFMSRRMSSEGVITADGLMPRRYDQQTKIAFGAPARSTVLLEPDHVLLANGQRRARWAGVQDTASQFVQLAWQFSTHPELLRPGATITVPLALPHAVSRMVYDVSELELQWTSFGEIPVYRLKPRLVPKPGGDLSVEMWIAPQYRYLPIRLKIHQDAETFVDLLITKPPELGMP